MDSPFAAAGAAAAAVLLNRRLFQLQSSKYFRRYNSLISLPYNYTQLLSRERQKESELWLFCEEK
jgi:hypothetical protein